MTLILTFLKMNGYGFFIWTAYGCVMGFLITQWCITYRRWKNIFHE